MGFIGAGGHGWLQACTWQAGRKPGSRLTMGLGAGNPPVAHLVCPESRLLTTLGEAGALQGSAGGLRASSIASSPNSYVSIMLDVSMVGGKGGGVSGHTMFLRQSACVGVLVQCSVWAFGGQTGKACNSSTAPRSAIQFLACPHKPSSSLAHVVHRYIHSFADAAHREYNPANHIHVLLTHSHAPSPCCAALPQRAQTGCCRCHPHVAQ